MTKGRNKGYELMREIGLHEIVGVIRSKGSMGVMEIVEATGRSRSNVDSYLRELEAGGHVLRGLPPVSKRKGSTFLYSAPVGEVRELPARKAPPITSERPVVEEWARPLDVPPGIVSVHTDYDSAELREAAFQASQVVNSSRGKPIPMYEQQIQGTPVPARDDQRWRPGFTHLTKGGDFELRDDGGGKTLVRRVYVAGGYSIPVTLATSDALAMFVEKSEQPIVEVEHKTRGGLYQSRKRPDGDFDVREFEPSVLPSPVFGEWERVPRAYFEAEFVRRVPKPKPPIGKVREPRVDEGEVWTTPAPSSAPVPKPRPRIKGADDLGHFGQGSRSAITTDMQDSDEGFEGES